MPVLTPDQILKLDQGECVFINPGYKGGGEASIPFRSRVRVSPQDIAIQKRSIELWNQEVRDRLIQRETKRRSMAEIDQENVLRREMALRLLPLATLESASDQQDFNADITEDEFDDAFR
jgi:type IV secretion system protein VirD4